MGTSDKKKAKHELPEIPMPPVPADGQMVAQPVPTTQRGCLESAIAYCNSRIIAMAAQRNTLDLQIRAEKFTLQALDKELGSLPNVEIEDEAQLLMFGDPDEMRGPEQQQKGPRHQKPKR